MNASPVRRMMLEHVLTPCQVHHLATQLLLSHMGLTDYGRTCPATTLLTIVFAACTRLGIDTSYRQMNQCRARTCTRNPGVRLFWVAVALLLRNVWVGLHWEVLSGKRRGRRLLRLELLTLKALLQQLLQVAGERLGFAVETPTEHPIPDRLSA